MDPRSKFGVPECILGILQCWDRQSDILIYNFCQLTVKLSEKFGAFWQSLFSKDDLGWAYGNSLLHLQEEVEWLQEKDIKVFVFPKLSILTLALSLRSHMNVSLIGNREELLVTCQRFFLEFFITQVSIKSSTKRNNVHGWFWKDTHFIYSFIFCPLCIPNIYVRQVVGISKYLLTEYIVLSLPKLFLNCILYDALGLYWECLYQSSCGTRVIRIHTLYFMKNLTTFIFLVLV